MIKTIHPILVVILVFLTWVTGKYIMMLISLFAILWNILIPIYNELKKKFRKTKESHLTNQQS